MSDKTITPEGIRVEVGQVWIDQDKRCRGRTIRISHVDSMNGLAYYEQPKNRVSISRLRRPFWILQGEKP